MNKKILFPTITLTIIVILIAVSFMVHWFPENRFSYFSNILILIIPQYIEYPIVLLLSALPLNSDPGLGLIIMLIEVFFIPLFIYAIYFFAKKGTRFGTIISIAISLYWIFGVVININEQRLNVERQSAIAFYDNDKLLKKKLVQGDPIEICRQAPEYNKENCYFKSAQIKRNPDLCKIFENNRVQDRCFSDLTNAMPDVSICEMIHTGKYNDPTIDRFAEYDKDFCYKNIAMSKKNIDYCNNIKSVDVKNLCFAVTLNDKTYCDKISISSYMEIDKARQECKNNFN